MSPMINSAGATVSRSIGSMQLYCTCTVLYKFTFIITYIEDNFSHCNVLYSFVGDLSSDSCLVVTSIELPFTLLYSIHLVAVYSFYIFFVFHIIKFRGIYYTYISYHCVYGFIDEEFCSWVYY